MVESAVSELVTSGGGNVIFGAGDFDLGSEFFKFYDPSDITFAGQGIDITVLRNSSSAAEDTEPFNCSNCDRLTIRDMTIVAGGPDRTTSDALDFDDGDQNIIERIKVTDSRGRAIVFDGKGTGGHADGNIIRDCIIEGPMPLDGIQFLGSSNNHVENCTITGSGRHGIYMSKASSSAEQPNKPSDDNVIAGNIITNTANSGIAVLSSSRNIITDNTLTNNSNHGIYITTQGSIPANDNVIEFNTVTGNANYGLNIANAACFRTVVEGNDFSGNGLGEIRDFGTDTIYIQSGTATPTPSNTPTQTPTTTPTAVGSGTIIVSAIADAYVNGSSQGNNYGGSSALRTDASPTINSYLRFQVPPCIGINRECHTPGLRQFYFICRLQSAWHHWQLGGGHDHLL